MNLAIGPYASAAPCYREAGHEGVLHLPALSKSPPPDGFTGHQGRYPTHDEVAAWMATYGEGNVALRLGEGLIGIDVDHYGTKRGGDLLAELEAQWGRLPDTWISTARSAPSGIRLFRVPVGVQFTTAIPGGIEIVQYHHRYMVVWPSVHPDTGMMYRWISPDGDMANGVPPLDEIPALPEAWVEGLTRPWTTTDEIVDNGPMAEHREHDWSRRVTEALDAIALGDPGGRHDAATAGAMALARLEQLGHPGATAALDTLGERFVAAVTATGTGARSVQAALQEWGGPGGIAPSARQRARTSPAVAEPYLDPSWVFAWAAKGKVTAVAVAVASEIHEAHDFIGVAEEPYRWLVPDLIEHGDRLILTGPEGKGKSTLLRQMAVQLAAGTHPFDGEPFTPFTVLLVDCENSTRQIRRKLRALVEMAGPKLEHGRMFVVPKPEGIDLGTAVDFAWLEAIAEAVKPSLLIIGPIYKMSDGDPIDETTAKPIIKALDLIRTRYDCALLIEAHTPHESKTERPFGASIWKRWPEFGLFLDPAGPLRHWRGARDEREWPAALQWGRGKAAWPWERATGKDITYMAMVDVQKASAVRMSVRAIADVLTVNGIGKATGGVSKSTVHRAIQANLHHWNQLMEERGWDLFDGAEDVAQ